MGKTLRNIISEGRKHIRKTLAVGLVAFSILFASCRIDPPPVPPPSEETIPESPYIRDTNSGVWAEPQRVIQLLIRDHSDNEDGFSLERKIDAGPFTSLASLPKESGSGNSFIYNDFTITKLKTYTYRIRAHNGGGNSDWDENSPTFLDLLHGSINVKPSADTHVSRSYPNNNYGNSSALDISKNYPGSDLREALVLFSLPTLPSYSEGFDSALLSLHEAGGGNTIYPGLMRVYAVPILNSWSEDNVTWNNRPGSWLSTYGYGEHNPNDNGWLLINVSNVVSDWYSNVRPNRGFFLFTSSDNKGCSYYTEEGFAPGSANLNVGYNW
jgi:hypothetical protein